MVNDQTLADLGTGVDLYAGTAAAVLGYHAGQKFEPMSVAPVGPAVITDGPYAGVEGQNLPGSPGGGVSGLVCIY